MSQQTQIERVATYWRRWIDRWPDAVSLSNATQEEVNEMWAGLGYYRRARYVSICGYI
jgi:A/G-specific adenine glycosylase